MWIPVPSVKSPSQCAQQIGIDTEPTDIVAFYSADINNHGDVAFVGQTLYRDDQNNVRSRYFIYFSAANSAEPSVVAEIEHYYNAFGHVAADGAAIDLADNNSILFSIPTSTTLGERVIELYHPGGSFTTIASIQSGTWQELNFAAQMSDDGAVIVFAGDRGNGYGIFASVAEPDGNRVLVKVVGEADTNGNGLFDPGDTPYPELGYNADGEPIFFDLDLIQDVFSVFAYPTVTTYQDTVGDAGAIESGESFLVQFYARPSEASRLNPITGQPLLFTANVGLWSLLVRAEGPLDQSGPSEYLLTSAHPIVQVGDSIAGRTILGFPGVGAIFPIASLATARRDQTGTARGVTPGDHHVAFIALVDNNRTSVVMRASQLDSDGDGLYDHWETEGVDIDQDGTIDLNLPAMGAHPLRKDLFLEVDWIADDNPAGNPGAFRSFEPDPDALDFLVDVFATAPVANPDGTMGITVHIDAGAGLSRNMGPVPLQGGDRIAEAGTGNHIQVLYFGGDGTVSFPGQADALGRPIVTRSVEAIKADFFGTADKWARELAFRYVLFGDRHSDPNEGSSGRGELTFYGSASFPHDPWQ